MNSTYDGYTSNFRFIDGVGNLGLACGCYEKYIESDEALENYANNRHSAMELEAAKKHARNGKLVFIERFIGGLTDPNRGWGGFGNNGKDELDEAGYGSVRNGDPDTILADFLKS